MLSSRSIARHRLNDRSQLGVNVRDGDAVLHASDVHLGGVGLDASIDRYYNSLGNHTGQLGPMWRMSVGADVYLSRGEDDSRWDYVAPNGQYYGRFVRETMNDPSGTDTSKNDFHAPLSGGLDADLHDNGDNTYTLTFHSSQIKYTFGGLGCGGVSGNNCNQVLTKQVDRNGNEIDYNYNCSSTTPLLTSIKDTHGRYLHILHDSSSTYITSIVEADPGSDTPTTCHDSTTWTTPTWTSTPRTWTYHFNSANQLDYYIDPTGARTDYAYGNGLLTTISDPAQSNGNRPTTTITYGAGNIPGDSATVQQVTALDYATDTNGDTDHFTYDYGSAGPNAVYDSICNTGSNESNPTTNWSFFTRVTDSTDPTHGITDYCFKGRAKPPDPSDPNPNDPKDVDAAKLRVIDGNGNHRSGSFDPDEASSTGTAQSGDASGSATVNSSVYSYNANNTLGSATEAKDDGSGGSDAAGSMAMTYTNKTSTDNANASPTGGKFLPSSGASGDGDCTGQGYDQKGNLTDSFDGQAATSGSCGTTGGRDSHVHYSSDSHNDGGEPDYAYGPVVADLTSAQRTSADETNYSYYYTSSSTDSARFKNGELRQVVRPGGDSSCTTTHAGCTSYDYDGYSRVISTTDGNGNTTRFTYDQDDRITAVMTGGATTCGTADVAAGNCIKYTYDAEGNLTERDDHNGATTFRYDMLNRAAGQTQPNGTTLSSTYDAAGNLRTYTQAIGAATDTVNYTYDKANQLQTVSDATGTFNYTENSDGRPKTLQLPTSPAVTLTYAYTGSGKLKSIDPSKAVTPSSPAQPTDLSMYSYDYHSGGQDTGKLQKSTVTPVLTDGTADKNKTAVTTNYDYYTSGGPNGHGLDRFEDTTVNGTTTFKVSYDDDSNIRSIADGSTTTFYGYNEADQLCWSGPADTAASPAAPVGGACGTTPSGDTRYTTDGAGENLGTSAAPIHYNSQQQVDQLTNPNGTGGAVNQTYLDQGNNLRLSNGTDAITTGGALGDTARVRGAVTTFYTRDPSGQILDSHDVVTATGVAVGASSYVFYYLDRQGSTLALLDSTGTETATYAYTPYGRTSITNIASSTTGTTNPWRYTGGYQDPTDGYYHFGARYYDTAGHFTQADSIAGNINRPEKYNSYTYTAGDPVDGTDLSGRNLFDDVTGAVATVADGVATVASFIPGGQGVAAVAAGVGAVANVTKTVGDAVGAGDDNVGGDIAADAFSYGAGLAGSLAEKAGAKVISRAASVTGFAGDVGAECLSYC